ncbi:MAG: CPBP family intramembrane metalloprotease [Oscillospiraceae bacterium]|nr:CPBP family intramembrane metalloprotease [Oscillospiraceae bacterium]
MAKKIAGTTYMTGMERIAGTIFFLVYLLVMPLLASRLFDFIGTLLGTHIAAAQRNVWYYYVMFALTLLLFHEFIAHTTSFFFDSFGESAKAWWIGLVAFYGANELLYRVCRLIFGSRVNLNDVTIAAQIESVPRLTAAIIVFFAPFVEEVLFRGLVFGCLKEKSRFLGYAVSCALFAFLHVWSLARGGWTLNELLLLAQYIVPGAAFAWAYDRSGTLWPSILLHMTVNALALWVS